MIHGQEIFSFEPAPDAYLQDGTRYNDNFLKVKPDSRVSYLKFEVTGLANPVESATLQLQENGNTGNGTLRIFRGSHNDWTERNLSVLNAPTEDGQVGTFTGAVNSAEIIRIDVTPLITVDGTYSIIVKQDAGGDSITFGSSESSRKPLLVIETSSGGPITYNLTVHSGSGDGDYPAGTSRQYRRQRPTRRPAVRSMDRRCRHRRRRQRRLDFRHHARRQCHGHRHLQTQGIHPHRSQRLRRWRLSRHHCGKHRRQRPTAGQQFDQWTGDVAIVADVNAASTSITMPAANATVTATYKPRVKHILTVNSGSGDGDYPATTVVNIVAATAPAGQQFDKWTGDVAIVAPDVNAASTSITMPAANATVTATYKPREYTLTVNSGSPDGNYPAGAVVNIVAATAPAGQQFDKWTGDVAIVANVNAASTSVTMPAANATVTATYKPREYTLTVNSGSPDGNYPAGAVVNIVAATAPAGQQFDKWTGDVAIVANVNAASTSVTMPAANATVTATYKPREYTLTVNSGSPDGNYPAGAVVNIVAATAPAGQQFDKWTGDVAIVANVNAASTSVTMPAANATVTATYKPREYTLTVNSGSPDGNYPAGTVVNIVAATAPAGQQFDKWTGDVAIVADVNAASTSITMPAANATVTATYKPREYTLTVNSGSGDGNYPAGTVVNLVAATAPAGQQFDKWTGDVAMVANVNAASTSVTMPSANATVTATYKAVTPVQYTLTVNGGSGSGSYAAGASVNIVAATAPAGQQFDQWTGDVAIVANVNAASTSVTMPSANATVTATYKAITPVQYTLTVNGGSGSGSYAAGASVNIVAATAPAGQQFDQWTGDVAMVANVNAASTSVTMPAANATVTATYKAITPVQYTLTVNGGTGSGSYAAGASVNIVAATAPAGQQFDQWTGDVAMVANVNAASTSVTMPSANATVTATYKAVTPVQYTLTVNGGTGSGSYAADASVNLVANAAPAGQQFDQWTGDVADVANVNAASTSVTMPAANATLTATYLPSQGGIGTIGPVSGLTATANAGMITSINGIPVSDLLLGTTSFPTPPAQTAYPPRNADNFDLSLLCAGDGQPYIDFVFSQPVMSVFLIENGGNDSGFLQALDAAGNPFGDIVEFAPGDYLDTGYRSGNNQVVAGLAVWLTAPANGLRLLPPTAGTLGFDPTSVSASPGPRLELRSDPTDGSLLLEWFGDGWVLQHSTDPAGAWSDVSPAATSPYPVAADGAIQTFRLRQSGLD